MLGIRTGVTGFSVLDAYVKEFYIVSSAGLYVRKMSYLHLLSFINTCFITSRYNLDQNIVITFEAYNYFIPFGK